MVRVRERAGVTVRDRIRIRDSWGFGRFLALRLRLLSSERFSAVVVG